MDCNDYKDKIISYIEDELTEIDREQFENELEINSDLKREYCEVKQVLQSLSGLPKLKASSDFMVSLNKKIDTYELKEKKGWGLFVDSMFKNDYFPKISAVALSLLFILTVAYLWSPSFYNSPSMLSNSSSVGNDSISNAIANLDSLDENFVIDE